MTHELLAICDTCKKPVADGEGSLWVDMTEVDQATVNRRAWEQLATEQLAPGIHGYSAESLMTYPKSARWQVHHVACDPAPDANAYAIDVHRCRSWADLVLWTAHLMGKAWLSDTDWEDLLEAASQSAGSRITPVVPPTLNH
ncbi:hypothetical protein HLK59_37815 [Streptomyces sp. S3(2020)]|uniref:hypothetical protein n=1 Tax=Streptomyces sp. S3(2020) TaxID=2732044 RepID=UPI00148852EB|nr:hypothetical protein [Streptomyces sp. S3(2020)]NNN36025.1 hypothetical protein [Streptomyces sp. S3(2020)]